MLSKSSETSLRVAIVGCGPIGALHAGVVAAHPQCSLVAVCAPSTERRNVLAKKHHTKSFESLDQVLEELAIDCVVVASPDVLHADHTLQALQAECHVLCEKPLGQSLDEVESIMNLSEEKQLKVGVTYNRRYAFGYQQGKALLQAGTIGKLQQLNLQVTDCTPPSHVVTRSDVMFWTLLGHQLDLLRFLGGEMASVNAHLFYRSKDRLMDRVNLICELESGGTACLMSIYRDEQTRTTERCEIFGSHGSVVIEDATHCVTYYQQNPDEVTNLRPDLFLHGDSFYESLRRLSKEFFDRVISGEPIAITPQDAWKSTRLAEAALESHASGEKIKL